MRSDRPIHSSAVVLLALVGACASSGGGAPDAGAGVERTVVGASASGTRDLELFRDRRGSTVQLPAAPQAVFAALAPAFAGVGLEGAGPAIGRERTWAAQPRLRRVLDKVPLSRYLDCGRTATGELAADTHLVRLVVTSAVTAAAGGSTLATQVSASATSVEGSNSPLECSSNGVLEGRIHDAVAATLK
jgi:hypothetical protein